ncbi:hypothetical protein [Terracoccus sp. 273MFTsu3.1]|uniref:hypothetical protein n=1 Tax=Terracoccus sp. 273MFTsu3.1 TaxID=1172188 RepID=UPI00035E8663|nr:hypothetical protein [Terracoccus sp. 273MFTsu3.1]
MSDRTVVYEIRVEGHLDGHWSAWLGGLALTCHDDGTTLCGPVVDRSRLYAVLARLGDLDVTLLSLCALGQEPGSVDPREAGDPRTRYAKRGSP